jgi:hypothetical protein
MHYRARPRLALTAAYILVLSTMAVNFNPRSATVLLDQLDMLLQGACVSEQLGAVLAHYYDVVRVAWNMWTFEVFVAGSVMLAVVGWRVGRGAADGTIPVRQRAASVAVSKWLSSLVSIGLLCVMWTGFALFVWIVGEIEKAGARAMEQWGFGQVLAILIWLPVLVELGYVFTLVGVKEG